MKSKSRSWLGLYILAPLAGFLLYLDATATVGEPVHTIFLAAAVLAVVAGAFLWTESHAELMRSRGVNAQGDEISVRNAGIDLTVRARARTSADSVPSRGAREAPEAGIAGGSRKPAAEPRSLLNPDSL